MIPSFRSCSLSPLSFVLCCLVSYTDATLLFFLSMLTFTFAPVCFFPLLADYVSVRVLPPCGAGVVPFSPFLPVFSPSLEQYYPQFGLSHVTVTPICFFCP